MATRGSLAVTPARISDISSFEGPSKATRETRGSIPGREDDFTYPPGGEDHLGHQRDHMIDDHFAAQMTAIFILEFGVIFHSIFIGLTRMAQNEGLDAVGSWCCLRVHYTHCHRHRTWRTRIFHPR